MRMEQLKSSLNENVAPIYLIDGDDAYLRELSIKHIENKVLSAPDLNLNIFEGSDVRKNPEEMISALMQYPFMSDKRVVLVRDYNPTATDLKNKALKGYLDSPTDTSVLIIANSTSCAPLEKIENVTRVDCSKADMRTIIRYIQITLKKYNLIITTQNAQLIAEYCRNEMARITGEVEKLSAYANGNSEVTREDIELLVNKESDYKIYEFTDKVAQKNNDSAYQIMKDMLAESTDYQRLFTSLYYHFRRLFFCMVSRRSPSLLAKSLGIKEFAVNRAIAQAKMFSPKRLKAIVDMFAKFDGQFKMGKISIQQALTLCMGEIMQ